MCRWEKETQQVAKPNPKQRRDRPQLAAAAPQTSSLRDEPAQKQPLVRRGEKSQHLKESMERRKTLQASSTTIQRPSAQSHTSGDSLDQFQAKKEQELYRSQNAASYSDMGSSVPYNSDRGGRAPGEAARAASSSISRVAVPPRRSRHASSLGNRGGHDDGPPARRQFQNQDDLQEQRGRYHDEAAQERELRSHSEFELPQRSTFISPRRRRSTRRRPGRHEVSKYTYPDINSLQQ